MKRAVGEEKEVRKKPVWIIPDFLHKAGCTEYCTKDINAAFCQD
jgi:hypothetical protein